MSQEIKNFIKNRELLKKNHIYKDSYEHDNCGVGLVASINGESRRDIVEKGVEALKAVFHRGAVDADGKTGDGAGIMLEVSRSFFSKQVTKTGHLADQDNLLGVGMIFLPKRDFGAQEKCRAIVEYEIIKAGMSLYGWRQVPVNTEIIGEKANYTKPEIEQIIFAPKDSHENIEKKLYLTRRRIENKIKALSINDFYICSLSTETIVYKGMFLAEQLSEFYPDLLDSDFKSKFAIYHQRYSTNTFPTWSLAQPFRVLAHNGEINTLKGNLNWMSAHEPRITHPFFNERINDLKPILDSDASDSASLDAAFELLVQTDRDLPMAKSMIIPEAWSNRPDISEELKNMYAYCNAVIEPWDGPAAVCGNFGDWIISGMDRNGLRPLRYILTNDGLLISGSEVGMINIEEKDILKKGRVGPGELVAINYKEKKFYQSAELKNILSNRQDFSDWNKKTIQLDSILASQKVEQPNLTNESFFYQQAKSFNLSIEILDLILDPMVKTGQEAIGSMGDDAPLSVLTERYRGLHSFFKQNFSQVTNPPIDSLREQVVMSLKTRLGNLGNIVEEDSEQCNLVLLESPVLLNHELSTLKAHLNQVTTEIDCTYDINSKTDFLNEIQRVCAEAEQAVRSGSQHLVITDKNISKDRIALPMILATSAVHSYLVKNNLRTFTSLNVSSLECLDVHYFAVLIGVGATTVNASLIENVVSDRLNKNIYQNISYSTLLKNYKKAIEKGLRKIISKMGISIISSYRGGKNFEIIGLSRSMVESFFPGMSSRISGIGLDGLEKRVRRQHQLAFQSDNVVLDIGGEFRFRSNNELHAYEGTSIHMLQEAVTRDSYNLYKNYAQRIYNMKPIHIRDLLQFNESQNPLKLDHVQSISDIRKSFVSPGISLGALSPEAHETLAIAMNRIGSKSDSGEGGEDFKRYKKLENGDNPSSSIKQVASGRFGVTAEYLNNCSEIEIKIAQGAKPGEGGQLPGFKVTDLIARLRHSTKGVTLISPPPHHDIYSIEDLAQLIYDLKQINPNAKVCVKLVAQSGIGTVAAGVAKAKADVILVSGHSGGTGASPQSSIKYAGLPWELGISEVHQILSLNGLRDKVVLRTDGGIKTGRDIVKAAILGAEEYGIGTASLVAMGCIMVRQCHSNTCPVGVCTQDEKLREKFGGTPEKVINLFSFIAEEVREILASLGFSSLKDIIGKTELLFQTHYGSSDLDNLDLNPILTKIDDGKVYDYHSEKFRNEVPKTLDDLFEKDGKEFIQSGQKIELTYNIQNTLRSIGTKISSFITRNYGMNYLSDDHVTLKLRGSAGQSLGAFAVKGLTLRVFGDANDYVGKGLSGGKIIVQPRSSFSQPSHENVIIGNVTLYGATAGTLYAAGQAGDRFCVRNSGALAVVEGCGANGCEYMTGGSAIILGNIGDNFGAGMTGGSAFIYSNQKNLLEMMNKENVDTYQVVDNNWKDFLFKILVDFNKQTKSKRSAFIIENFNQEISNFVHIVPDEVVDKLSFPVTAEHKIA
ncbi:glutamate synthase large subunit [Alphaproteobacteria bacterium]|nr:glutamate synthase large subunit [Alphaproteobacteria bacterium]